MDLQPVTPDQILSGRELEQAFSFAAKTERDHDARWADKTFLFRVIIGLGLRISEVAAISITGDLPDGVESGIVRVRSAKNAKAGRIVKCSPELLPHWVRRVSRQEEGPLFRQTGFGRPSDRQALSVRQLRNYWYQFMKAAGITRETHPHTGRHTFASHEIGSRRLQPYEVQAQLGHKSLSITMGVYAHASTEYLYEQGEPRWRAIAKEG